MPTRGPSRSRRTSSGTPRWCSWRTMPPCSIPMAAHAFDSLNPRTQPSDAAPIPRNPPGGGRIGLQDQEHRHPGRGAGDARVGRTARCTARPRSDRHGRAGAHRPGGGAGVRAHRQGHVPRGRPGHRGTGALPDRPAALSRGAEPGRGGAGARLGAVGKRAARPRPLRDARRQGVRDRAAARPGEGDGGGARRRRCIRTRRQSTRPGSTCSTPRSARRSPAAPARCWCARATWCGPAVATPWWSSTRSADPGALQRSRRLPLRPARARGRQAGGARHAGG